MTKLEKLICQQMAEQRVRKAGSCYVCSDDTAFKSDEWGKQLAEWHEERLLTKKLKYEAGNATIREARDLVDQEFYWLAADPDGSVHAYRACRPVRGATEWKPYTPTDWTRAYKYTDAYEIDGIITWSDEPIDLRQWLLTQENLAGLHPHPLDKEAHQQ